MAFIRKKVEYHYYEGDGNWSTNYADRKVYASISAAEAVLYPNTPNGIVGIATDADQPN